VTIESTTPRKEAKSSAYQLNSLAGLTPRALARAERMEQPLIRQLITCARIRLRIKAIIITYEIRGI
jgi:hypothetical protein